MSCLGVNYNPKITHILSRTENRCIYDNTPRVETNIAYKAKVLQYPQNSSRLTKSQIYSQKIKGFWTNNKTNFATQTEIYTNNNINNLRRVGYTNLEITNEDGSTTTIQNGGILICNSQGL